MMRFFIRNDRDSNGYLVMVRMENANGFRWCSPMRNFGDRQSDAMNFRDWDCPKFTETQIKAFVTSYKPNEKYKRIGFRKYRRINDYEKENETHTL